MIKINDIESKVVSIRVAPDLRKRLRVIAASNDLTVAAFIRREVERIIRDSDERRSTVISHRSN